MESPRRSRVGEPHGPPPVESVAQPRTFRVIFTRRQARVRLRTKKGADDQKR